ncbi:hypothetical protein PENSPDRAFT_668832 [Peniophora sp. CONT]|nr:hypothetical protein PENSPDRAFT_668832 [Peniophora sp. CONT]
MAPKRATPDDDESTATSNNVPAASANKRPRRVRNPQTSTSTSDVAPSPDSSSSSELSVPASETPSSTSADTTSDETAQSQESHPVEAAPSDEADEADNSQVGTGALQTANTPSVDGPAQPSGSAAADQPTSTSNQAVDVPAGPLATANPGVSNRAPSVQPGAGASTSALTPLTAARSTPVPMAGSAQLQPLRSCIAVTLSAGRNPSGISAADLDSSFEGREDVGHRIRHMLKLRGSHANAVNLLTADPRLYNGLPRYVVTYDRPPKLVTFFLIGLVTYNGLDDDMPKRGRQLCIAPFNTGFSRGLAVLRHLCGEGYIYMNSYRKGLSISTGGFDSKAGDDRSAARAVLTKDTPGALTHRPLLEHDTDERLVPVRDGRERFSWETFLTDLPAVDHAVICEGMVCAVLFTVGFYKTTQKEAISTRVRKTAGLNIQSIVIIDEKNPFAAGSVIEDYNGELDDGVELDPTLSLAQAINPLIVAQPSEAAYNMDTELA